MLPAAPSFRLAPPTLSAVPPEIEPPELARLVDYAECARAGDWSLRSALVRYAQPEPARVSRVLELVRRIDAALGSHAKLLQQRGPALWASLGAGDRGDDGTDAAVLGLLRAATTLDELADQLAAWAVDRAGARPDAAVDTAVADVTQLLDDLGVAREERQGPPSRRG
jgi:hypothetical protein